MDIITNYNSDTPIYMQITNQLKRMIINGEIVDGFMMPSERKMAKLLGVHRNTVIRVYLELKSDNYLESIERKGYVVCNKNEIKKVLIVKGLLLGQVL